MHGVFAWNELGTSDVDAAIRFYERTFERFAVLDGACWVAKSAGVPVDGIGGRDTAADPASRTSVWTAFLRVGDIDRRFEQAIGLGASPVQPPHDVPDVGRVAVLRDPTGALISWLQ